jgi:hypothetical protein
MGIILRQNKGSELTFAEVDGNFQSLYYSSSLSGTDLQFFFASSSVTHSIDLQNVPGFTGVTIESGSTLISNGVQTLNFLGDGIASITNSPLTNQVDINIQGGGGGGSGTGIFQLLGATDIYFATSSLQLTASTYQESEYTTIGVTQNPNNDGTGGNVAKYGMMFSQSVWHYTDNVGYPTSKPWKTDLEGSVFDRYDQNTDTAEILRFIATQLSESSPDVSPNARFYSGTSEVKSNTGTTTEPGAYVPQSSTDATLIYLQSKGFAVAGQTLFPGISPIYNNSNYNIKYTSVAAGSTTCPSSSNDPTFQLFNLGAVSSSFTSSGSLRRSFSDNSAKTITAAVENQFTLVKTPPPFNTTNGQTIGAIPTVGGLPITWQDGKFTNIFQNNLYNGGISFTTKESTGYYYLSSSIGVQSGSSNYTTFYEQDEEIFYTDIVNGDFTQLISFGNETLSTIGVATRSLSGAPYLNSAQWKHGIELYGLFTPMYSANSLFAGLTDNNSMVTLSNPTSNVFQGSTAGATVQTANFIYGTGGTPVRSVGTIPIQGDQVTLSASVDFNSFGTGNTNITQTSISPLTFDITARGRNFAGALNNINTEQVTIFTPGTFGAEVLSGSMAYYGRSQGYDGGSLTGTSGNTIFTEQLTGEDFRIIINDKLLTGSYASGDKPTTSTDVLYVQPPLELQVKPGYLVTPAGTYGYWLPANPSANTYQYYARAFQRNLPNGASDVTASFGAALNTWDSSANGVSVAFLFSGSGAQAYTNPRIFDPATTVGDALQIGITNNNFTNPFSDSIDLYACKTGTVRGSGVNTSYEFPLLNGNGMTLDQSTQDFIVIIRYKGDPVPIEDIDITIT